MNNFDPIGTRVVRMGLNLAGERTSRKRCFADLVGVRRYDADFDRHDAGRIE
ncbi:MAG: hypothetical protein HKL84_10925 [Acidimicrobiaceae bacterium]|nr:hypothetical protein [Acidimicrobiaceae bacterium]